MQELLGRISRLDPSASLGLRVIACFDELVVGKVGTRALLAAAASLAGCVAGCERATTGQVTRVGPDGTLVTAPPQAPEASVTTDGARAWLERAGEPLPNDAIILERLALALRIRHAEGEALGDRGRHLRILLGAEHPEADRLAAATALRLASGALHRVVAAPLFAVWRGHPEGPEDVITTRHGAIHALVVPAELPELDAAPAGVGVAAHPAELHRSFSTALVALRLTTPGEPLLLADDYAGLVELLADGEETVAHAGADAEAMARACTPTWAHDTITVLLHTQTLREAARELGIHHSTLQSRVVALTEALGFDPTQGYGRVRLGVAHLVHRLRTSTVLELPPPSTRGAAPPGAAQAVDRPG